MIEMILHCALELGHSCGKLVKYLFWVQTEPCLSEMPDVEVDYNSGENIVHLILI